jgi:uncharacterized phage-associated protein
MQTSHTTQRAPILEGDYKASDIAKFFILKASEKQIDEGLSEGITNLKLQKILYFAQAAHVALYDKKIFKDKVVAWKFGPIVEQVYYEYKIHKNNPLPTPTDVLNISDEDREFLDGIWGLFEKYSASELVSITHSHAPWKDAYEKGQNTEIPVEQLRNYYRHVFELEDGEESTIKEAA